MTYDTSGSLFSEYETLVRNKQILLLNLILKIPFIIYNIRIFHVNETTERD